MFTNVVPGSTEVVRPWVEALRNVGFAVFAKPKVTDDSDVDDDMLAHIELRADEGGLAHVVVASGDGRAFRSRWRTLAHTGTCVTVIGFREHANFALTSEVIEFVDLEDIDGRLPRAAAADDAGTAARHRRLAAAVPVAPVAARAAALRWGPCGSPRPVVLPCDPACSVLRNAAVDVADGPDHLGRARRRGAAGAPARCARCPALLLPGLVNTHCHTPMLPLRGMGGDLPLMRWLHEVMWPAEGRLRRRTCAPR